jgi:hypothetical protein
MHLTKHLVILVSGIKFRLRLKRVFDPWLSSFVGKAPFGRIVKFLYIYFIELKELLNTATEGSLSDEGGKPRLVEAFVP